MLEFQFGTLIKINAESTRACHDAGNELRSRKMASLADLTPRELEILQMVIAGKTNKAIASEIYISKKTIEYHLDCIYTKIGNLK
jgi:DNA-binding NarL/FixJ family response regulator